MSPAVEPSLSLASGVTMSRGRRMKVLRAVRGWSQTELGAKVGVSRQTINSIEAERSDPSLELALKIARALEVTVDQLFG